MNISEIEDRDLFGFRVSRCVRVFFSYLVGCRETFYSGGVRFLIFGALFFFWGFYLILGFGVGVVGYFFYIGFLKLK